MADRYGSFAELKKGEREGIDFRVCALDRRSPVVIVAPHGGYIEPMTAEIAAAIAADRYSVYCFEGLRDRPHRDLHITSDRFDEPRGLRLVQSCEIAIGVHGRADDGDRESIWMGGRLTELRDDMAISLRAAGYRTLTEGHSLTGTGTNNICNRGKRHAGVQLELPRTLRDQLRDESDRLTAFGEIIRAVVDQFLLSDR